MDLIIKAIEEEETLATKQRKILIEIYKYNYPMSATEIKREMYNKSRQFIHATLHALLEKGFIKREKNRVFLYSVNQDKMKELLEKQRYKAFKK